MERLKNIAVSAVAPLPPPARNNRAGGNFSICLYQFYCSDTEMPFYKNGGGAGILRHKPTREFFFRLTRCNSWGFSGVDVSQVPRRSDVTCFMSVGVKSSA
jgi:hypothetical protein